MSRHSFPLQNNCLPHSTNACQTHCQQIPESRAACKHRKAGPSYTLSRQPFPAVGRRTSPRQHVAELRYQSVRRHRTSDSDTLPFPRLPRSGGARQYQMYGVRRPVKSDGAKTSDTLPFPCLRRSGGAPTIPKCRAAKQYDVNGHKGLTTLQTIPAYTVARK